MDETAAIAIWNVWMLDVNQSILNTVTPRNSLLLFVQQSRQAATDHDFEQFVFFFYFLQFCKTVMIE